VRARLGDPANLPDVMTARARQAGAMDQAFRRHMAQAQRQKQQDLAPLERKRQAMTDHHRGERQRLYQKQDQRREAETRARQARFDKGLLGLWHELSGRRARIREEDERAAWAALQRDRKQRDDLIAGQLRDRQVPQQEIGAVRARYAEMLKDLRQDHKQVRALTRQTDNTPQSPATQERLEALRSRRQGQVPSQRRGRSEQQRQQPDAPRLRSRRDPERER